MDMYLEKHRTLVLQAEELATAARHEAKGMPSVLPGQQVDTRKSAYALTARRKLMEMSKVIASIERLSQQHLCEPSVLDYVTAFQAPLAVWPFRRFCWGPVLSKLCVNTLYRV